MVSGRHDSLQYAGRSLHDSTRNSSWAALVPKVTSLSYKNSLSDVGIKCLLVFFRHLQTTCAVLPLYPIGTSRPIPSVSTRQVPALTFACNRTHLSAEVTFPSQQLVCSFSGCVWQAFQTQRSIQAIYIRNTSLCDNCAVQPPLVCLQGPQY